MVNCRVTANGFGVQVPRDNDIQFDDLTFVEIAARNCDLTGNELGSWSLPESVRVQANGVREQTNKSIAAMIYRRANAV